MNIVSDVASIIQLVDFTLTVLSRIKDFVDSRTDAPKVYRTIANQLPLHIEDIRRLKQSQSDLTDESSGIVKAINSYNTELLALDKLLETLLPKTTASKPRRILTAVYSFAKDKQIKSMWKNVQEYRATLLIPCVIAALKPGLDVEIVPSLFDIPLLHTPNFVPRPHLMGRINELFVDGGPGSERREPLSTIVVLLGMGGQGKTQLALSLCRNAKKDGTAKAIFWIDSSSRNAAMNSIKRVAKRLSRAEYSTTVMTLLSSTAFTKRCLAGMMPGFWFSITTMILLASRISPVCFRRAVKDVYSLLAVTTPRNVLVAQSK